MEQARRFAEAMERSWRDLGFGKWLAYENSTGALLGRAVLGRRRGCRAREGRLGVAPGGLGPGYATEIGRARLDLAFSVPGVDRVVSFTKVHNARSRAVMERLGMRYARQIRQPGLIAGSSEVHEAAPFALYRITRSTYAAS